MDFEFSEEQNILRRTVREFTEEKIKPIADQIDEEKEIPKDLIKEMAQLGFFGACFPAKYGGSAFGEVGYCIVIEELNRGSPSVAILVGAHESLACTSIYLDGSEELKERFLFPMAQGEKIGSFALTEPEAGSDAAAIRTEASDKGDHYLLNGGKIFATNGDIADVIVTFAVTDRSPKGRREISAFVIEPDMPGFAVDSLEEKMGIRGAHTAQLSFNDVKVPKEYMIGEAGTGLRNALTTLDYGRVSIAAGCAGQAKELVDLCTQYARQRQQFGKPISKQQAVQFMLAEMTAKTYSMESIAYRTAWMVDKGKPFIREASIAKLKCSEWLDEIADMAVQIHGGYGYIKEYPIERFYRDSRINRLYEGTSEIQRLTIGRDLLKKNKY